MASRKPDLLDRLLQSFSFRALLLHQTTLFLVATTILILGAIGLWNRYQGSIVIQDEFRLTEDKIHMSVVPNWVDEDLTQLINGDDSKRSLLDSDLVPTTAERLNELGYVERVQRIEKSKTGLNIDVLFRQPVALVELSEVTIPEWPQENRGKNVLLPVDRVGVIMPEKIAELVDLPMITVLYPARFSELETWGDWPDERVKEAASISELFAKLSTTGIHRIVTFRKPQDHDPVPYELWSHSGAQLIWGNPPGKEQNGEAKPAEKLAVIQALVQEYGSINSMNQVRIDIRSGKPVLGSSMKTAAKRKPWFSRLK